METSHDFNNERRAKAREAINLLGFSNESVEKVTEFLKDAIETASAVHDISKGSGTIEQRLDSMRKISLANSLLCKFVIGGHA
ncbi:MAG TPA: hypothetical protein VD884_14355 [Ohtaekwangia sp.]|nr:hypothetical protein [Ohtaekwangia sp.]